MSVCPLDFAEKVRIAKVHKAAYERQLKKILPRLEQLQEELDTKGSKFIVATRVSEHLYVVMRAATQQ